MTALTVSSTMSAGGATITASICEVCGTAPCVNPGSCRTCRQADARLRDERTSPPQQRVDHGGAIQADTFDDPYAFVLSANAHPRHLTQKDKRKRITAVLKAKPRASNVAVAKQDRLEQAAREAGKLPADAAGKP